MSDPKVLLVEDNDIDKELFEYLCGGKYDITWVKTLKDAKDILSTQASKFDCLVIDLKLPDSAFPNTILELQQFSERPMIVLTGIDEKELIAGKANMEKIYKYLLKYRDSTKELIQSAIDGAIKKNTS